MTTIISGMGFNYGEIGPGATELAAHERLKICKMCNVVTALAPTYFLYLLYSSLSFSMQFNCYSHTSLDEL